MADPAEKPENIENQIRQLARQNGVTYQRLPDDGTATIATRLAGDEVVTDDVEDLIVALRRANVISGEQMVELLGRYLRSTYSS
jgi:hypothetical protein